MRGQRFVLGAALAALAALSVGVGTTGAAGGYYPPKPECPRADDGGQEIPFGACWVRGRNQVVYLFWTPIDGVSGSGEIARINKIEIAGFAGVGPAGVLRERYPAGFGWDCGFDGEGIVYTCLRDVGDPPLEAGFEFALALRTAQATPDERRLDLNFRDTTDLLNLLAPVFHTQISANSRYGTEPQGP